MTAFMRYFETRTDRLFATYDSLYRWSVDKIEDFWEFIWHFTDVIHSKPPASILSDRRMPGTQWFQDARLNFSENLLKYIDDNPKIISLNENGDRARLTYRELR